MKERGLLMSPPMVQALLDGSKAQTRRPLNPQPDGIQFGAIATPHGVVNAKGNSLVCKYGKVGDRLWCRETFFAFGRWETRFSEKKKRDEWHFIDMTLATDRIYQFFDPTPGNHRKRGGVEPAWWKRPAIFMPRAASRITLEITSVSVERLQDISEADAIAEGIELLQSEFWRNYRDDPLHPETSLFESPIDSYRSLWESINGTNSWSANPFVWKIQFGRVEQ